MCEGEQVDNLVKPQVQDKTQGHSETQSSEHEGKLVNENAAVPPVKYMRSEHEIGKWHQWLGPAFRTCLAPI